MFFSLIVFSQSNFPSPSQEEKSYRKVIERSTFYKPEENLKPPRQEIGGIPKPIPKKLKN